MHGLTPRQLQLFNWLKSRENQDVGPSYQEICDAIGITSKSGASRLVKGLAERGAIEYLPTKSRSIKVKCPN